VTVGKNIANSITPPCSNKYPVVYNGPDHSFVLHETFPENVEAVINRLLKCKSVRMNDIPVHIRLFCKNALSPFLTQIFNLCMRKGSYPKSLNCAQVVPIHKGGQKDLYNNYRPISLLSLINKIFEKLLYSRLYFYIKEHNMLSKQQNGFRRGLSTSLAIHDIHENFLQNTEKGLTFVLYSVIYLRPFKLLIMRYFYGSWNISMGLEVYCTHFLLVICKTDSSIVLLGGIGRLPGGNSRGTPGFITRAPTICLICEWPPTSIKLNSYTLCWWHFADDILCRFRQPTIWSK